MARTNLPLTTLHANGVVDITGTAVDVTNGMNVVLANEGVPAGPGMNNLVLYVTNTAGADKTVTVRAGVGGGATPGAAYRSGEGDLVVTVHTASGGGVIGPLESARFAQSDGSLNIDFGSGLTGNITAYILPARF